MLASDRTEQAALISNHDILQVTHIARLFLNVATRVWYIIIQSVIEWCKSFSKSKM